MLWAVLTLIAAAAQTARNAMQRESRDARHGRCNARGFCLFGFPFALLFSGWSDRDHRRSPTGNAAPAWPWVIGGALGRKIAATSLMLSGRAVIRRRLRLYQNRAGAGGFVWPDFPRRSFYAARRRGRFSATPAWCVMSLKPGAGQAGTTRSTLVGLGGGTMFALSAAKFYWAFRILCWHPHSP